MSEKEDLVDTLIAEWGREIPNLSADAMGIVGRTLRLGRVYEARANAVLKPYGLNYTDLDVLATIRRSGAPYRLTPTELLNSVLITSGAMTAALNRLNKAKLITRVINQEDKRSQSAELTSTGKSLTEKVIVYRFEDAEESIKHLSPSERKTLEKLLRKLLLPTAAS